MVWRHRLFMLEAKLLPRQAKDRMIEFHAKPLIMGVVNVTPDSFFDGGRYVDTAVAVAHAVRLVEEGADLLDIGAESTRPGADAGIPDERSPPLQPGHRRQPRRALRAASAGDTSAHRPIDSRGPPCPG